MLSWSDRGVPRLSRSRDEVHRSCCCHSGSTAPTMLLSLPKVLGIVWGGNDYGRKANEVYSYRTWCRGHAHRGYTAGLRGDKISRSWQCDWRVLSKR